MMITKVGKRRKEYPDHKNIEFMSLADYLKIAHRVIGRFANGIRPGLANQMLNSEDAVSHVAYHLMLSHWNWRPDGGRTLRSYLNQHGIYAIQNYVKHSRTKKNKILFSINTPTHSEKHRHHEFGDTLEDTKNKEPILQLLDLENSTELNSKLETVKLTNGQRTCLLKFVNGMSYTEIAEELKVSRQNVQQLVKAAIQKCREAF